MFLHLKQSIVLIGNYQNFFDSSSYNQKYAFTSGPSWKEAHESGITFSPSILKFVMRRIGDGEITVENCFSKTRKGLLSIELTQVLQDIIRKRDEINNGVRRQEAIQLIVDLSQWVSKKSAESHLDYLIRSKKLTDLKRKGRVVTAQAITTERYQINLDQQLRWLFPIESEWNFQRRCNISPPIF